MKQLTEYSTNRGELWLLQGNQYFGVVCHIQTAPGSWRIREFGHMNYEEALEKFDEMQAELDNRPYTKPRCTYSSKCIRPCRSCCCPAKLGGTAYWDIFSNSCYYKVR